MTIYTGTPQPFGVSAKSGKRSRKLALDLAMPADGKWDTIATPVCKALLLDVTKDQSIAEKYATRFRWRIAPNWNPNQTWTLSHAEVETILADIRKVEIDTVQTKRMAQQEPAPTVNEGGRDVTWTKKQNITPNIEKKT